MKIIERDYLKTLIDAIDSEDIKVISGLRRSGKSVLLNLFADYLRENMPNCNIISINFNLIEFENLKEYHTLLNYILSKYKPGQRNFVLIDEVQMCEGFENTINDLHARGNFGIYLTGSNAFLLGNDLATLFTGRVFNIDVYPFSYKEFLRYYSENNREVTFEDYLFEGGLAGSFIYPERSEKYSYLRDMYDTMIIRDILQKYDIRKPDTLDNISNFMLENISNPISLRSMANTLNSNSTKDTNYHTLVGTYLGYLQKSYAFYKVSRFDIAGKQFLASQDKYYTPDHALRYAKLGTKNVDHGKILENIVAIELLRRGYELYVGILRNYEVDFVAIKDGERTYFQVSYDIASEETISRELRPLEAIRDSYPKVLLARTNKPEMSHNGIRIINVEDWLRAD